MMLVATAARRTSGVLAVVLCSAVLGAELVRQPSYIRLISAACIGISAVVASTQWPRAALVMTIFLLPYLALVRRLLLEFTAWKSADPLLLVAPTVLALVLVRLFVIEKRPVLSDRVSKVMAFLLALTFLEAFNPRGGGLSAGTAALLYTAVPLLWFFAGRELATRQALRRLFAAIVVSASLIGTYGLIQTWDGFPSWDRLWVASSGYAALDVGTAVRAFGTFSSSAEYASFLATGLVVAIAFALDRRPFLLPAVPLLGVALFYESGRAIVVTTTVAVLVVLAARTGSMRRATVALVVLLSGAALAIVLERGALQSASSSSNSLVSHQAGGLLHPLNQQESTLPIHISLVKNGFERGVVDPIGFGIGSTTLAGSKLGNPQAVSTEVDVSNQFVALGTFGGFAYLAILAMVLTKALRQAVDRRDAVSLATLGMLVAVFGQWLNGGYYAVSPLIWFVIGFLIAADRAKGEAAGASI